MKFPSLLISAENDRRNEINLGQMSDSVLPRRLDGPGWIPSVRQCLEINAACDHFFAIRGMTFLSLADRIRIDVAVSA